MKKRLNQALKNEKGFTLIELIIVIVILAVIAAIAVPNIMTAVDNSRKTADVANAKMIANAAAAVKARNATLGDVSGSYDFSSTGVAVVDTASAGFATAISTELNNARIVPKYIAATTPSATHFRLTIDATSGAITVVARNADGGTADLFPTPATTYGNK